MFEHLAFTSSGNINISKNKSSKVNKRTVTLCNPLDFYLKRWKTKLVGSLLRKDFFLKYFIFSKNNNKITCRLSSARSTLNAIYSLILLGTQWTEVFMRSKNLVRKNLRNFFKVLCCYRDS